AGKFMASTDEVYIDVIGKGGHAALPEGNINPIVMASDLITKLYDHFAQESDFDNVFSIGSIKGGSTGNIIPDKVRLQGTFRALDMTFRKQAHNDIRHICDEVSKSHRGNCELTIVEGYPVLQNDIDFTKQCANNAKHYMGEDNVLAISKRMTAEDFAYYSHYIPSCFYRIGVGDSQSPRKHLHNAKFDIDESAIRHSMGLMSWLAVNS
ncbi:MAG: M20/M25/M40 family metallo-hydrolase, partial [Bacteroidota bacterium]|nr:M20/M25/M40 family metallo-hydrolase [Bacteroidota bacterium]